MPNSSQTQTHPDLGLTVTLFEPYSNLAPELKSALAETNPEPIWHDSRRGLRLYQGDALELLHRAKSETFDLIFADPPYFLSSGGITCQSGRMVSVDKGEWDKTATFEQIHAFNLGSMGKCVGNE